MIYGKDAASGSSPYASLSAFPPVHTDLIVAATGQFSWDGVATGANKRDTAIANCKNSATGSCYCDKQRVDATDIPQSYSFETKGEASATSPYSKFTNARKCTYIFTVAPGKGAPAFKLDRADW
jgi:hypothetical protein